MKTHIFLELRSGERIVLNVAFIMAVRKLNDGCEVQMSTGLLYAVNDSFTTVAEFLTKR